MKLRVVLVRARSMSYGLCDGRRDALPPPSHTPTIITTILLLFFFVWGGGRGRMMMQLELCIRSDDDERT